jgi:uncharacterized protein (TIGR00725 family)
MYVGRVGIKGVVCVVGGADASLEAESRDRILAQATALGKRLAELQSVHLLTGGGSGVMKAVSEGFYGVHPRSGIILGIIPKEKAEGYPNDFVEIPIFTHLDSDPTGESSSNHINIATASVVIALPGGDGTLGELELATKAKFGYKKPTIVYLADATDTIAGKNASALKRGKYTVTESLDEVITFVTESLG